MSRLSVLSRRCEVLLVCLASVSLSTWACSTTEDAPPGAGGSSAGAGGSSAGAGGSSAGAGGSSAGAGGAVPLDDAAVDAPAQVDAQDSGTAADAQDSAVQTDALDSSPGDGGPIATDAAPADAKAETASDGQTAARTASGQWQVKNAANVVHTCTVTSGTCNVNGGRFVVQGLSSSCDSFQTAAVTAGSLTFMFNGTAEPTDGSHDLTDMLDYTAGKVFTAYTVLSLRRATTGTVQVSHAAGALHAAVTDMPFPAASAGLEPAVTVTGEVVCQ
jgi:hypothetical protein